MKRTLLFLLVSLAVWGTASAQDGFPKGEASLGVSAAVVSSLEGDTDFSIGFSVGTFLTEHWDMGIGLV